MSVIYSVIAQINCCYMLIVLVICLTVHHMLFLRPSNLPPGPFNLPLLGSLLYLGSHPERVFSKWGEKYGPVIFLRLGRDNTVVLNNYEAIEQAFVKKSAQFNGRYQTFFTDFATGGGRGIMFLNHQETWKVQRRFGLKALSGSGLQGKTLEERILDEVELLCEIIRSKQGKPFVLESNLTETVSNIVNCITIQRRCTDEGNERLREYVSLVIQGFRRDGFVYMLLTVAPWIRFVPYFRKIYQRMDDGIHFGNDILNGIITEHEKELDPNHPNSMVDSFLIEHNNKIPSFERKEQLVVYLKDLLSAGTETTSSTIRWTLFYLIKYPAIQKRIHDEIDQVIGRNGKVRLDAKLNYTRAVIQEIYRIETMTPLGVPRCTTEETKFMGYIIPKNTQVIANLWNVHNDPKLWPNPRLFQPDRHLDSEGKFVKSDKIIPFSIGPRNCLGENLARMEVFLYLVHILQQFVILPNLNHPTPGMHGSVGPVYSSPHYAMIIKER